MPAECPENNVCFYTEEKFNGTMESYGGSEEIVNLQHADISVHNFTGGEVLMYTGRDGQDKEIRIQADHSYSKIPGGEPVRSFKGGVFLK
ncbi:MAG: peptidase inhibitor family I36 protein [Pseudonocardiaceae bacterium]